MATVNYRGGSTPRNLGNIDPVRTHGNVEKGNAVVFADESGRRIKDGGAMITSDKFADLPDDVPANPNELVDRVMAIQAALKG